MSDREPRKISRRDLLVMASAGFALAGIVFARNKLSDRERAKIEPQPIDQNMPFIPSIEIGEKIDADTFKKTVSDLYNFAKTNDIGQLIAERYGPDTESIAMWVRIKRIENGKSTIVLTKGARRTDTLDLTPEPSAYTVELYSSIVVSFSDSLSPTKFFPAEQIGIDPKSKQKIFEPETLPEQDMADFLTETIELFNNRTNEDPSPPRNPSVEKGYL